MSALTARREHGPGALDVYVRVAGARVRSHLQYRASFVMGTVGSIVNSILDYVVIVVVFTHLPRLGGWSLAEVSFLYGTSALSFGLSDLLIGSLEKVDQRIREGSFDQVLTRPLNSLLFLVADDFALRRAGRVLYGALLTAWALSNVDVDWTVGRVAMLPLMTVCGFVIFSAIFVVGSCVHFWTIGSAEAMNAFTYGGNFLTSYPMTLYSRWFRRLLGFLLGLAFVNWFPALYVFDKPDPMGLPQWLRFTSPAVAAAAALLAAGAWRTSVRHYRSTGS